MKKITLLSIGIMLVPVVYGQQYDVRSPDNYLGLTINAGRKIEWSLSHGQSELIKKGSFSFITGVNIDLSKDLELKSSSQSHEIETIESLVPTKFNILQVSYNKLLLEFYNKFSVEFRLYNDGFAYRLLTSQKTDITVVDEHISLEFPEFCRILFPEEKYLQSHYERLYQDTLLNAIRENGFASLPLLVQTKEGMNVVITDADLYDYPNLFLQKSGNNMLISKFPKAVLETEPNPNSMDRSEIITKEAAYIAKTNGTRSFPWRVFAVSIQDKQLLENQLVYNLSRTGKPGFEWVKPGKVSWDWWNSNNIYGVDFKSGINTLTYKYYIDFAHDYGLEYIILDEGWSASTTNLLECNPDINMQELMSYAKSKNIGIILWVLWKPLYENMDKILGQFKKWGAAGIKVDFMQRADQQMVNIYENIAEKAAMHQLLVDFHGAYKPSGLNRAYPNVLSYEGVQGLEQLKWSKNITPDHNLTLPFTRMVAGPMDYTPGAMMNRQKENFAISWNQPMSMGTRAHQAALYVVFESPLQMLADNPSNYRKDSVYTRFISQLPTVWDNTTGIDAKIGDYLIMARSKGSNWYVAGLTDWTEREIEIDLNFLGEPSYTVEILSDGANANTHAEDYKIITGIYGKNDKLTIRMAKGGGFAAVFSQTK